MRRLYFPVAALAAITMAATPASAVTTTALTTVNIVKPVSLSWLQNMDFGTLTFASFTGTRTITISRTGALTCAIDIVCSGVTKQARFNVQGTNKLVVLLSYSGGTLTSPADTTSIPFTRVKTLLCDPGFISDLT